MTILRCVMSVLLQGTVMIEGPHLAHKITEYMAPSRVIEQRKKKIVVFMSVGGAGHISVSQRLVEDLGTKYDVHIVNILKDVVNKFDPVPKLSWGSWNGEDLYNYLLRHNRTWLVNQLAHTGAHAMRAMRNSLAKSVEDYLRENEFDLVISCVHFVDGFVYQAAKAADIPFMIIPTDVNVRAFVNDIKRPDYDKFIMTIPFDLQESRASIAHAKIPEDKIVVTGYPVRQSFVAPKDKEQIRKDFNITTDKPIITILMGGAGSKLSGRYVKTISKNQHPMHLLVCVGRNAAMKKKIEKMQLPDHITVDVIGYTQRIADLLAISDIFITKAGGASFGEAIYSNIPMLVDKSHGALDWEAVAYDVIEKYRFGHVLYSRRDVNAYLDQYLSEPKYLATLRRNVTAFEKEDFGQHIHRLVEDLVQKSPYLNAQSVTV